MIWDLIKGVLTGILNILENILGFFLNFFEFLFEFCKKILVPKDNFFVDNFNYLSDSIEGKFGVDTSIIEDLKGVASVSEISSSSPVKDINFTVMGVPVTLKISFVEKIVSTSKSLANGLVIIFLCWFNIRKVIWIIRGTSPISGTGGGGKE